MATGLLALLDDITTLLDDVALLSKTAAQKTAGIVGDDLAVNAHGVVGIDPKRELPIVWSVAKGSLKNKAWLIPLALVLPATAITPLLMAGGAYLCYEGVEKVLHKKTKADEKHHKDMTDAIQLSAEDLQRVEKEKIAGAIKTDTVLSAEIVAIALGAVAAAPLLTKAVTLAAIGVGMTFGVYGLVGLIVKADDIGLSLTKKEGTGPLARLQRGLGHALVKGVPPFMKVLTVVGTAAMFTVGGGILMHGFGLGHALHGIVGLAAEAAIGIGAGFGMIGASKVLAKPLAKAKSAIASILKKVPLPDILKKKISKKSSDIPAVPVKTTKNPASPPRDKNIADDANKTFGKPAPDNQSPRKDDTAPKNNGYKP